MKSHLFWYLKAILEVGVPLELQWKPCKKKFNTIYVTRKRHVGSQDKVQLTSPVVSQEIRTQSCLLQLLFNSWGMAAFRDLWTEVFQWRTHNSHFVLVSRKKRLLLEPKKTVTKFSKEKRKHKNPNKQRQHFTTTHLWKNIKIFFHPEK